MRVAAPVMISVNQDQLNRAIIIVSSPIRLGNGGKARLARDAMNHQKAIRGRSICRPPVSAIVRVCDRS